MRVLSGLFLILVTYFTTNFFLNQKIPQWKVSISEIMEEMGDFSPEKIPALRVKTEESFPKFFPFSCIQNILEEAEKLFVEIEKIKTMNIVFSEESLDIQNVWEAFASLRKIETQLDKILANAKRIPAFLLTEEQKFKKKGFMEKVMSSKSWVKDGLRFEKILQTFSKNNERVLVLLQNQNEPRSTGGFVGSFLIFDFDNQTITWKFSGVYELDRKVPENAQLIAPTFFHGLSQTISLRDANFWPDFPISAKRYRDFFEVIDEKVPGTILAINLNFISEILKITGPVKLDLWNIEMTTFNFDMVLQFLVESKVAGRFDVKKPVQIFAESLLKKIQEDSFEKQQLKNFNWRTFLKEKQILAHSQNISLQKLFEKWKIDGGLRKKREADNFLYFDFVSIGANKSEKFMWTNIWHDSEIQQNGKVKNIIGIKRTHALKDGEIYAALGWEYWFQNLKNLMTDSLLWKLGAGENRTVIRIYVPKMAELVKFYNPSGNIEEVVLEKGDFKIFEVPMNVLPGESLEVRFVYNTKLNRGSHSWRPYFLQVVGSPGKSQTKFLETISTRNDGTFSAKTQNIGRPIDLVDSDFRTVIEFPQGNTEKKQK